MATKRKKKVWPKIKLVKGTASEIRAGVGVTPADHRRAMAALRAAGIETSEELGLSLSKPAKKPAVSRRSKSTAAASK